VNQYKQGAFFSYEFIGENSWNGYERKCLFANAGNGQFIDVARPIGADSIKDGRGVAIADFNGDGKLDIVINNNNSTPTIYLNNLRSVGKSIEIKLVGTHSNSDAIGAMVRLTVGGKTMTRQVEGGSGYASESMLPVHFGLGGANRIDGVEITWPSGLVQRFGQSQLDRFIGRLAWIEEGNDLIAEDRPVHGRKLAVSSAAGARP
jgi:hypothetical protein